MDGDRFDEGERVVEDEFACAGMLRGSLTSLHTTVERIFRVHFAIGTDQLPHGNDGQIWLKLRGLNSDVHAAKLFVKGVVNQEEQQEVSYPAVLHCVFCGARGLFMDCLIRSTSALVVVGSPGCLLISGLMEPVVRAYSLITDLVERCESTQSKHAMKTGERGPGESFESRRAFKNLVEQWDDRHTLDLLVLPGSVKEILLELVKDARLGDNPSPLVTDGARPEMLDTWDKSIPSFGDSKSSDRWDASSGKDSSASFFNSLSDLGGARGRPEGAEGHSKSPQEVGEEEQLDTTEDDAEEQHMQLSGSKEFWLLLKFFTAMGYTEDVVQRVLAKTGLQEASQILDLVQQEQDRTDREQRAKESQDGGAAMEVERNRPCETEHREDEARRQQQVLSNKREIGEDSKLHGAAGGVGELREDDFVLGVLKKAAASCGYNEKQVSEVYSMLPDHSMHQLLLELQKNDPRPTGYLKEDPREMDDVVIEKQPQKAAKERINRHNVATENRDTSDKRGALPKRNVTEEETIWGDGNQMEVDQDKTKINHFTQQAGINGPQQQTGLADIRGPPLSNYTSPNEPGYLSNQVNDYTTRPQSPKFRKQGFDALQPASRNDWSPTRTRERKPFQPPPPPPHSSSPSSSVVVTGEQRFLEGLHSRFELQLTDSPGDPKLRNIIIDGSNVAMSHGLGQFFSCRGIALAVQHFWDRGHRNISALVPQWRTKSDPRIKEQHYLTDLNKLGLVSYTPSREVQGKRISSYDDRIMLQLAQKTDGVIVTNDNLRDLSDESAVWRDIIKKRLLQYTFVGDHFMVPDDPLGRGGPHLDEFLSTEHRAPDPGSHTYSGVSAPFPSSKCPRSQTELLNYRDRSPRGTWEPQGGGGGGGGGGGRRGPDTGQRQNWPRPAPAGLRPERNAEETARLREELCQVFPGQDSMVTLVLQCHPTETDINALSAAILEED